MSIHVSLTQGAKNVMKTNFENSVSIALTPSHSTFSFQWNYDYDFTGIQNLVKFQYRIHHLVHSLSGHWHCRWVVVIFQATGQKLFPFKVIGRAICLSYHQWTCTASQEPGPQRALEHLTCSTFANSHDFFLWIRGKGTLCTNSSGCTEYRHWNCIS